MRELERRFSPEFRNRIDEVVIFQPLTKDEVRAIALQQIDKIEPSLAQSGRTLTYAGGAGAARDRRLQPGLRRAVPEAVIEDRIKLPISQRWTEGRTLHGDDVMRDGQIEIEVSTRTVGDRGDRASGDCQIATSIRPGLARPTSRSSLCSGVGRLGFARSSGIRPRRACRAACRWRSAVDESSHGRSRTSGGA